MSKERQNPIYVCTTSEKEAYVLTTPECMVLEHIQQHPECLTSDIVRYCGMKVGTVRTILHRMRKASLIEAVPVQNKIGYPEHAHTLAAVINILNVRTF